MSCLSVILLKDQVFFAADSSLSVKTKDNIYRANGDVYKIQVIDNLMIFMSGITSMLDVIHLRYMQHSERSIITLREICMSTYSEFIQRGYDDTEINFEVVVATIEKSKVKVYNISPDNKFEWNIYEVGGDDPNGNGSHDAILITAGTKTKEAKQCLDKYITTENSLINVFKRVYDDVSFEGIGGKLRVYRLNLDGVAMLYEGWILEKPNINRVDNNRVNTHRVRTNNLVAGDVLIGSAMIESLKVEKLDTATAKITSAMIESIIASKIEVGTLTGFTLQTAATGQRIVQDVNGLRSYDSSGKKRISISPSSASLYGAAGIELYDPSEIYKGIIFADNAGNLQILGNSDLLIYSGGVTYLRDYVNFTGAVISGLDMSDITGLVSALGGKASSSHSHAQSDISGLATALAGKASSSSNTGSAGGHNHGITPGRYIMTYNSSGVSLGLELYVAASGHVHSQT